MMRGTSKSNELKTQKPTASTAATDKTQAMQNLHHPPTKNQAKQKPAKQIRRSTGKEQATAAAAAAAQPATTAVVLPNKSQIIEWLRAAGLTKYCPLFLREEIDVQALRLLNDQDLQRIDIRSLGPRRIILRRLFQ